MLSAADTSISPVSGQFFVESPHAARDAVCSMPSEFRHALNVKVEPASPSTSHEANSINMIARRASKHRPPASLTSVWACDRCYRLKYKCDSLRPYCTRCSTASIDCKYGTRKVRSAISSTPSAATSKSRSRDHEKAAGAPSRKRGSRKSDTVGYVHSLQVRIRDIEDDFSKLAAGPGKVEQAAYPLPPKKNHAAPSQIHIKTERSKSDSSCFPPRIMVSPTLTNVSARCQSPSTSCISASPTDSHHSKHPFLTPPMPTPFQPRSPMVIDELFTPPVIHDIMRTFFDDCSTRWVQMPIHEATFMREFDSQPSYLVYALCAMSASSCGNTALRSYVALRGVPNYRAGEQYFWRALSMVNYMVQNPSLESCIALASLKYAASLANELQWSEPLRRATIDTAIKLNLHIDPDIEEVHGRLPWLMKEQMRRTWWAAFVMDTVDTNVSDRFATLSIPLNILPKLHSTGGSSWAVKPIAPSALYNSVTAHDGEPTLSAFVPDLHLDVAKGVYHFTGLFLRIMRLRGPIFQVLDATLKGLRGRDGNLEGAFPSPDPAAAAQWELSADVQHTIQDIHLELSQSLDLLPDWARSIDQYDTFSNNSADTYPPPWQLYTQHLIADCMYIALHLPTIFIYTRLKQPPSHPAISKAFSICLTHAHRVSARLRRLRTINPSCFCMSQYASFFVLYSAIVIIMAARLGVTGNVVPLADPYQPLYRRTTPLQDLHENLDIYLWFTHQMGHKHYFAAYAHAFIRSMRDECAEQSA